MFVKKKINHIVQINNKNIKYYNSNIYSNTLNNYYIAGLIHANGGFCVTTQRKGKNIGLVPRFHLTLEKKHEQIIKYLIKSLKVGYYRIDNKGYCRYSVSSIKDIINVVIPFFLKYQVQGEKFKSFIKFKIICEKLYNKEHYFKDNENNKTLYYLLNCVYNINNLSNSTIENKNKLLKYLNEEDRKLVLNKEIYYQNLIDKEIKKYENFNLNIDFIKGLFDGDGNITLYLTNNLQIRINFNIVQYKDNKDLLKLLLEFFEFKGNIYLNEGKNTNSKAYRYETKSIKDINNIIIPKFNNFNNDTDYNIKLFKLELIKDLICWMNKNNISSITNKEDFIKYLEISYKIFNNIENLTFEEYKKNMFMKYNFTNIKLYNLDEDIV